MHDTDQLSRQLAELRNDVRDAPLADTATVRRRGDRRRRNSKLAKSGIALAAVAAVGLVPAAGGVLDRLGGSTVRSGTVSLPAGSDADVTSISTDVLLPAESLGIGAGTGFESVGGTPPRSAVHQRVTECVVRSRSARAQERWYVGDGAADKAAAAYHVVIIMPSKAAANAEAASIDRRVERCSKTWEAGSSFGDYSMRQGKAMFHSTLVRLPNPDGKPILQAIASLRHRNVVTYVVVQTSGNPAATLDSEQYRLDALLQDASARLPSEN